MSSIEKISIALSPEMVSLVRQAVETGEYASSSESSRPGELHPQALTDSGLERLRSSGSYRPVAARRSNGQ